LFPSVSMEVLASCRREEILAEVVVISS